MAENNIKEKYADLIGAITNEYNEKYTVTGLLEKLAQDDSWEKDPRKRMQTIMMLKMKFDNA